ncbi:syndecan-2-B [Hydra vulgaris]|uniref:Syndecan-2-B n=1 Tax=Hydra vulgaris TaxID=6087 RepID=A0ABM4BTS5_HYDVU
MDIKIVIAVLFMFTILCESKQASTTIKKSEGSGNGYDNLSDQKYKKVFKSPTYGIIDNTEEGSAEDDDDESSGDDGSGSGIPTLITTKKSTVKVISSTIASITVFDINTPTMSSVAKSNNATETSDSLSSTSQSVTTKSQEIGKQVEEQPGINFTLGIIIGVVVGAVLAILVIIFLVYRLRKKDEGSYSLEEQSTQAFITNDGPQKTEKEVYA